MKKCGVRILLLIIKSTASGAFSINSLPSTVTPGQAETITWVRDKNDPTHFVLAEDLSGTPLVIDPTVSVDNGLVQGTLLAPFFTAGSQVNIVAYDLGDNSSESQDGLSHMEPYWSNYSITFVSLFPDNINSSNNHKPKHNYQYTITTNQHFNSQASKRGHRNPGLTPFFDTPPPSNPNISHSVKMQRREQIIRDKAQLQAELEVYQNESQGIDSRDNISERLSGSNQGEDIVQLLRRHIDVLNQKITTLEAELAPPDYSSGMGSV
ncbi:hypothetical protein L218DRAFT_949150 [Marasmius fiardii PR-910]|nr:hypothetical protein L218DRAFT_949150 [Marasmius fiardii PR-910]